jgi:SAM-dependent methyltransferase
MNLVEAVKYAAYVAGGRKPFATGYGVYKERRLSRVLAAGGFDPLGLPAGYGRRLDERIVEYPWLFSRLPPGPGRLLDAGSALNLNFLLGAPAIRAKRVFILTLAPERRRERMRPSVSYVFGDLRETAFRENWFDWIVCLSTLEHVGMDNARFYTADPTGREADPRAYLAAVAELHRILRPGGTLYVSVPFGRHRDHGWLQVFDDAMVDAVVDVFRPASRGELCFRYERDGWQASSREASRDATYFDYHERRRHDDDYAAAARAVLCLELVK